MLKIVRNFQTVIKHKKCVLVGLAPKPITIIIFFFLKDEEEFLENH